MEINEIHKKAWGHEFWVVNNDLYCGKILYVESHWKVSYHYHKNKHETFHILDGFGYFNYNGKEFKLQASDTIVIPQNTPHSFGGLSTYPLIIIEFSTPHDEEDSYRDDKSHRIDHEEYSRWLSLPLFYPKMIL